MIPIGVTLIGLGNVAIVLAILMVAFGRFVSPNDAVDGLAMFFFKIGAGLMLVGAGAVITAGITYFSKLAIAYLQSVMP
jgi:uncharacterized membrane protein